MRIQKVTIVLVNGSVYDVSGTDVATRSVAMIQMLEPPTPNRPPERCSGDCSRGGDGPCCNLPGCRG